MKIEIKKILYKFLQDGISSDDATQQVLDLFSVSESSELANAKKERDQYKKLWQQSQRLKRELIEKYNLPISEATLD